MGVFCLTKLCLFFKIYAAKGIVNLFLAWEHVNGDCMSEG